MNLKRPSPWCIGLGHGLDPALFNSNVPPPWSQILLDRLDLSTSGHGAGQEVQVPDLQWISVCSLQDASEPDLSLKAKTYLASFCRSSSWRWGSLGVCRVLFQKTKAQEWSRPHCNQDCRGLKLRQYQCNIMLPCILYLATVSDAVYVPVDSRKPKAGLV